MIKNFLCWFLIPASCCPVFSQTYITNVTVADVEKQKLVPGQTVIIVDEKISKIQPGKPTIPAAATVIDGSGKYLFPGLTDAHIHFFQNGGLYTRPDVIDLTRSKPYPDQMKLAHRTMEDKLRRYLMNGITNVIDVGATYNYLKQKDTFKNADYAPTIFMTGPLLTTYQPEVYNGLGEDAPMNLVKSVGEGIKMVQDQLPYHPDFIKIWYIAGSDGLDKESSARKNLPIIKAIIAEAHKNNLKVAVHATERITAQLAVENGADFLVHSIDDEVIKDDFVQLLKKNMTVLCPTLQVSDGYTNTFGLKLKLRTHDLNRADPYQLGSLLDLEHITDTALVNSYKRSVNAAESVSKYERANAICLENLKKLSNAGVTIVTGTDAGNIGTLHASSYLEELKRMQKSGMTNWQIIQASTINGAKVFGKENEFGTVTPDKKANLILLDANPIEDIENITKINLVINRGFVISPDTLVPETPAALAQRQLNAYNFRNIDAFLEPYADDVEVYSFPDSLLFKGKETMRKSYSGLFEMAPDLHCELLERIVQGNIVIDKERIRVKSQLMEAVAIYHIENNKIRKVYFVD